MSERRRAVYLVSGLVVLGGGATGVLCCGGSNPEAEAPAAEVSSGRSKAAGTNPAAGGDDVSAPEPVERGECAAGAVLAVVKRKELRPNGGETVITIHEGGAYRVQSGSDVRSGCVEAAELEDIKLKAGAADFTPPPPPERRCMAMPTMETSVRHPASGRSASAKSPCGDPVDQSVADLIKAVLQSVKAP